MQRVLDARRAVLFAELVEAGRSSSPCSPTRICTALRRRLPGDHTAAVISAWSRAWSRAWDRPQTPFLPRLATVVAGQVAAATDHPDTDAEA